MGRGRSGVVYQSKKADKRIPKGVYHYIGRGPGGLKTKHENYITPHEIKIAEQLTPQQLVKLLLGGNTSAGRDDIAN